jgi:hypothetical protein
MLYPPFIAAPHRTRRTTTKLEIRSVILSCLSYHSHFAVSEQLPVFQRQWETHEFDAPIGGLVQQAAFCAGFAARDSLDGALDQARVAGRVARFNKQRFAPRRGVVCRLPDRQVTSAGFFGWVAEVCRAAKARDGALADWIPERAIKRDWPESVAAVVRQGHRATTSAGQLWAAPHA